MAGRLAAVVLVCLVATPNAGAQIYTHISGRILDPSEAGVPDAAVSLVNEDTGFRRITRSLVDGVYTITSLEPGSYRLAVRKEGFRTVMRFGLRLDLAQPARLNITLPVGSIEDTITVESAAPLLDAENAAVATGIPRAEIARLPMNGRGVLALLELAPGTVATPATRGEPGQFTANGQRPNANYFTVDGVSANTGVSGGGLPAQATGGVLPGMSAFGSMDSVISMDAVEEFRVTTSTAAPEFGRLPGASITLVSRAGSSDFHGSTAYGFRHELLAANDWFANRSGDSRAALRLHQFSQNLGGPIHRNRTFFFLSYEGLRLRQPYAWSAPVPSLAARAGAAPWVEPVLALFPVPNGADLGRNLAEWTGRNKQPAGLNSGSVRVDHSLTARITLFARYQDTPSTNEFGNTEINRLDMRSRSVTLGASVRPSSNLAFDLRLNASHARAYSAWRLDTAPPCALDAIVSNFLHNPGPCDDFVRVSISGAGQLLAGSEGERYQTQYQAVTGARLNRGAHALRFGGDYRRLAPQRRDSLGSLSILAESIDALNNSNNLWHAASDPIDGSIVVRELSLWAHDTWRATPGLTVSAGVRWEYSPSPVPSAPLWFLDPGHGIMVPDRRPFWADTYANFAPRIGVAWRPFGSERTVLRAGGGIYYNSSLSVATDSINGGPLNLTQHGSAMHAPFSMLLSYGYVPGLTMPFATEWSGSVERALSSRDVLSAGYVGSAGRRLLRREMGGPGSSPNVWMALTTNHGRSDYHSLQVQYRRRFGRGFQGLASYSWSHSLDDSSSDSLLEWAGPGAGARRDRGSSDFDLRHAASAGLTVELLRGWQFDGMFRARTGFPISVISAEQYLGISFASAFRPDLVAGQPLWIADAGAPGGRRLNPAAFRPAADTIQGSLGRNALSGFAMSQVDAALRREFRLSERATLQFRAEAFNALNQAAFADPVRFLDSPLFGRSTSMLNLMLGTGSPGSGLAPIFQTGGPRSIQLGLRFSF